MQKRGWGKRAEEDPTHHLGVVMFEFIAMALVIVLLLNYVRSFEKGKALEKSYLAKDLALMTFAVQQSPGYVNYVYTSNQFFLQQYSYSFDRGQVFVQDLIQGRKGTPFYYPYIMGKDINLEASSLDNPFGLIFQYDKKTLTVTGANLVESMKCPVVVTKDVFAKQRKIAIDPAHGVDTRLSSKTNNEGAGIVVGDLREQDITRDISISLDAKLKGSGYHSVLTRSGDSFVSQVDRASVVAADDVISLVSIHAGQDDSGYDTVKASIYSGSSNIVKSEKLACLILTEFGKKYPKVFISQVERVDDISSEDLKILAADKVAVHLEVGNMGWADTILKSPGPELAEPIAKAIVVYYE